MGAMGVEFTAFKAHLIGHGLLRATYFPVSKKKFRVKVSRPSEPLVEYV